MLLENITGWDWQCESFTFERNKNKIIGSYAGHQAAGRKARNLFDIKQVNNLKLILFRYYV